MHTTKRWHLVFLILQCKEVLTAYCTQVFDAKDPYKTLHFFNGRIHCPFHPPMNLLIYLFQYMFFFLTALACKSMYLKSSASFVLMVEFKEICYNIKICLQPITVQASPSLSCGFLLCRYSQRTKKK